MFKSQTCMPDPARLVQREKQLRDYHVRNWLRTTRTSKELMELCLNHFYSDQPKLLGWSLNMVDGDPKGLVIATMIRESKLNVAQAEIIYQQMENMLQVCRSLVEEVSRNTALSPQEAVRALHERVSNVPSPGQSFLIVNRPSSISICAILLFLSAALTAVFIIGNFDGATHLKKLLGTPGIVASLGFTFLSGWGYWNMRRWAVLLYALEPILRFSIGMPHGLIAIPLLIVAIGVVNFGEMTWK